MIKLFGLNILTSIELINLTNSIRNLQEQVNSLNNQITSIVNPKQDIPTELGKITYQEELDILKVFGCQVNITDNFLLTTSVTEAQKYVDESKVQYNKWVQDTYDCDNFSASLYGYWSDSLKSFAFGMARSSNHQFNIMIDNDHVVWIVEPQLAKFYTIQEAQNITKNGGLDYTPTLIWM